MSQRNSYFDPFARYNEHDSPLDTYGSPVVYHHLTSTRAPVLISPTLRYVGADDSSPEASEVTITEAERPLKPEHLVGIVPQADLHRESNRPSAGDSCYRSSQQGP